MFFVGRRKKDGANGLHIVVAIVMMICWSRDDGGSSGCGVAPAGFKDVSAGSGWVSMVTAGHQQAGRCPLPKRNEVNVVEMREEEVKRRG